MITKEEIVASIQDFHARHGRIPTHHECRTENSLPGRSTIALKFGSFNKAITESGFEVRPATCLHQTKFDGVLGTVDRQTVIGAIKAFAEKYGHPPGVEDCCDDGLPSSNAISRLFGSFNTAITESGFRANPSMRLGERRFSDEELLSLLRLAILKIGYVPLQNELRKLHDMPAFATYVERFGSFRNALAKTGVKFNRKKYWVRTQINRTQRLISDIIWRWSDALREDISQGEDQCQSNLHQQNQSVSVRGQT
jgi:hypothetical protein